MAGIVPGEGWSDHEVAVMARAVVRAPSVRNTQPWALELEPGLVRVRERPDVAPGPPGHDRLISCGAALANLFLAVRVLGWQADLAITPEEFEVGITGRKPPSDVELHSYTAISRRRSHRRAFARVPVRQEVVSRILDATVEGVRCRRIEENEIPAVAVIFEEAARALRGDRAYQAELAAWTTAWNPAGAGDDLLAPGHDRLGSSWAGLVRATGRTADHMILAHRMELENLLVFCTATDSRMAHVRTGLAMQRTWLAIVDNGLAASVFTRPLHVHPARGALADKLAVPGLPQLVMRLGHLSVAVPRTRDDR